MINDMSANIFRQLKIGSVRLDNNIILAPMAGVTDYPFRLVAKLFGAGLTVCEMINVTAMHFKSRTTPTLIRRSAAEKPYSVQIFGHSVEHFESSVRNIIKNGAADIIDINMGCPAKNVVSSKSGVYLMKDRETARKIITACVRAAAEFDLKEVPITVKIRLGWDKESIIAPDFCKMIEDCGASMVTVHARTYSMQFSGLPLYEHIARCKEAVKIPVIANGDIVSYEKARKVLELTGADGVMIGRAVMGRPWIIGDMLRMDRGLPALDFKIPDVIKLIKIHGRLVDAFYSDNNRVECFRKQLLWYTKGWYGSAQLRESLKTVSSADEIDCVLDKYLESIHHLDLPENRLFTIYENEPKDFRGGKYAVANTAAQ